MATAGFVVLWTLLLLYRWPADEADFSGWFYAVAGVMTFLVFAGGPFACYATARVLRPHPVNVSSSRRLRHMLAALCTAYGLALLSAVVTDAERGVPLYLFGTFWWYLLCVLPLTPVTLAWGVASAVGKGRYSPWMGSGSQESPAGVNRRKTGQRATSATVATPSLDGPRSPSSA